MCIFQKNKTKKGLGRSLHSGDYPILCLSAPFMFDTLVMFLVT